MEGQLTIFDALAANVAEAAAERELSHRRNREPVRVRTGAFRAALESPGAPSKSEVCHRAGFLRRDNGNPDVSRLNRMLRNPSVNSRTAVLLAVALNIDPVDAGF